MKTKYLSICLIAAAIGALPTFAAAEEKLAVLDMARAIFSSELAQKRLKDAEASADFVALKAKYESAAADLKAMAQEAESKRMTWSQEQLAEHKKKMEYSQADAELAMRKIQAESQGLQQSVLQELGPKAREALQEVVQAEGVTVLLKADSVIMFRPEADLTAKVTEKLNSKTK